MYKRVQAAGKSLFFRGKVPQLRNLLDQLSPRGLMLLVDGVATDEYLSDCRRYLGVVPWL
ncbi:MAG: hypothetical protein L6R48_15510 [Planctomycetes bacterium]|nr:hypothetical protein [Planctomycetota bacterium]